MFSGLNDDVSTVLILIILQAVQYYSTGRYDKIPCRTSKLRGAEYVSEVIQQNHPRRVQEIFRMPLSTLFKLERFFLHHTDLRSSRYVNILEKIAMFMHVVGHKYTNREVQERFQHSGDTVSRCFQQVLKASLFLHAEWVKLPAMPHVLSDHITSNPKFTPYFNDCLGALDGTHVPAHISSDECRPYRNRNGCLTQNVLAACNFEMHFCYVLPGWEGSAHDSRVLKDAMDGKGFVIPVGKYWLGDAGYSNSDHLLVPYKGVRYHLKETLLALQKPKNAKELFNLRHFSLRNVIERIFGVAKKPFPCLKVAPEFSKQTQIEIVYAITALHNFIRKNHPEEEDIFAEPDLEDQSPDGMSINGFEPTLQSASTCMDRKRDEIAEEMWIDYQEYLRQYGKDNNA